jgi:hypothetical protein
LTGWLEAQADDGGGPVALLLDRLRTVGHLPALPGLGPRVQRVTAIESFIETFLQKVPQKTEAKVLKKAVCIILRPMLMAKLK